jgi:glycine/D-amino acid oxidase-like deaminating enzyme
VSDPWDEEFDPSTFTRHMLVWAHELGASTLGEAYDMLEQLQMSNDVPEVLGEDGTIEAVRDELDLGIELVGPDSPLTTLL